VRSSSVERGWRDKAGVAGVVMAAVSLTTAVVAFSLLELSFKTWRVGRYFDGHAGLLVDTFLVVWIVSVLTLVLSLFGHGRLRVIGTLLSMVSIIFVALVFRCG
jgi:hypothetical protein